jgi:hypothetical protein
LARRETLPRLGFARTFALSRGILVDWVGYGGRIVCAQ